MSDEKLDIDIAEIKALFESNSDISCKNCAYSVDDTSRIKCRQCGQGYPYFKRKVEAK